MISCDECGFVYASVLPTQIGGLLRHFGRLTAGVLRYGVLSEQAFADAVTRRPSADVWSAHEYGCHLVDVFNAQVARTRRALVEENYVCVPLGLDRPEHVAKFSERSTGATAADLIATTEEMATIFDAMSAEEPSRSITYHWPVTAVRSLAWLGQHTIHEARHHLGDMTNAIGRAERFGPNFATEERTGLESWLDHHRSTLRDQCSGLDSGQLRTRSASPSTLSPVGLLRHLTEVERYWFLEFWPGATPESLYLSDEYPDGDFDLIDDCDTDQAWAQWYAACADSRRVVADVASLDALATNERHGSKVNLRWILVHMIEEYARHNGHIDILRQRIDGHVDG